jgi:hypothetical protein
MPKKVNPSTPVEVPKPEPEPVIYPDDIPDMPLPPEELPDIIPDEEPFITPPYEIPEPGEGP